MKQKAVKPKMTPAQLLEQAKAWLAGIDRKTLIQNGIAGGAFLIFVVLFLLPLLARNKAAADEVNQLKSKITNANAVIGRLPDMRKQKEIFGVRMERVRSGFFKAEEVKQLIQIISKIAGDSRVRITASQPGREETPLPTPFDQVYRPVTYELNVEGGYHDLGLFLYRLEHFAKNFEVREFKMTSDKNAPGIHKGVITLSGYFERYGKSAQ